MQVFMHILQNHYHLLRTFALILNICKGLKWVCTRPIKSLHEGQYGSPSIVSTYTDQHISQTKLQSSAASSYIAHLAKLY
jgi:hypothetical protein